jgi:D-hexose-6-phosphate mutarotase
MEINVIPEKFRRLEIPGRVEIVNGHGQLPLVKIRTPPLIFMSEKSFFAAGKPIRGGVPICFPWFGNRDGEPSHGFARLTEWQLVKTTAAPDGTVTVTLALPPIPGLVAWQSLRMEFIMTVGETLAMELTATNESSGETMEIENCLHTYFHVGDISAASLTGLQGSAFDDFAFSAGGVRRNGDAAALRITQEINRVYPENTAVVEIRDEKLKRIIRVEKINSKSTVVWNPWTTQKMPEDWGAHEHLNMLCVESGNVKQNKILLAPGGSTSLKVVLSSRTI